MAHLHTANKDFKQHLAEVGDYDISEVDEFRYKIAMVRVGSYLIRCTLDAYFLITRICISLWHSLSYLREYYHNKVRKHCRYGKDDLLR